MELNDELLQRFLSQQDQILAGFKGLQQQFEGLKLNQRRMRGEVRTVRGEVSSLSGKLDSMKGDLLVTNATLESLEDWAQRVDQKLHGVEQLAKSTFDMSESVIRRLPYLSKSQDGPEARQPTIPPQAG